MIFDGRCWVRYCRGKRLHTRTHKQTKCFACFRSSNNSPMIGKAVHLNLPWDSRFCLYCECTVEDEFHFVMCCPLYNSLRHAYTCVPYLFSQYPNKYNFTSLMSSKHENVFRQLAMYIFYSLHKRQQFIDDHFLLRFIKILFHPPSGAPSAQYMANVVWG